MIIIKQHTAHCKLRHSTTTIRYPICWQSNDQAEQKHSPRKRANKNGSSKADQNIHLYKSCDLNLGSSKNRKSLSACWSYKRCFCTIPIEFKLNLDIETNSGIKSQFECVFMFHCTIEFGQPPMLRYVFVYTYLDYKVDFSQNSLACPLLFTNRIYGI